MRKYPHLEDCKCGHKNEDIDQFPLGENEDWYVNSPEYHNCFWTYLRHNKGPHTLGEIAKLLNLSISAITSIERKAFSTLRKKLKDFSIEKS